LGIVAEEQRDWDEAERCYRESLRLKETGNNLAGVCDACAQLGNVAQLVGKLDEAESWYKQALSIIDTN
jgi:tetratricopeptide (TPR) repeat protein